MNFITIEHKDGEITLAADRIDSFHKSNERYHVLVKHPQCSDSFYELSKEQYDKIVARFTY